MTSEELIAHLHERVARDKDQARFGADEIRLWPAGAHPALVSAGVLRRAEPAQVIACDGCERNCFKPVHVRNSPIHESAVAFITCDEPEDHGRIRVELSRLEQWHSVGSPSASELARAIGQRDAEIGAPAWRKRQAKAAADARHSKPGGSRDVQQQVRAIWSSGKYTSRDRCAEEECAALGISYSTARKALRNTPDPDPPPEPA